MDLQEIRNQIDEIDDELLKLFLKRMELSGQVAEEKKRKKLPVLNRTREREILSRVRDQSKDFGVYSEMLFQTLFDLSKAYQATQGKPIPLPFESLDYDLPKEGKVALSGTEGSYSQMAADRFFPRGDLVFENSFAEVIEAVTLGKADFGILPLDNSNYGSVREVYRLLREEQVYIVAEKNLQINHNLYARQPLDLTEIQAVYSHPQALGQCGRFLAKHNLKTVEMGNTSFAALHVAQSEEPLTCIGSPQLESLYGLVPIEKNVSDSDNNYTRFVVIERKPKMYRSASKTTISFHTLNEVGGLYSVLSKFTALGFNLTKLESSPVEGRDFEFSFILDFDARLDDTDVRQLLSWIQAKDPSFRILGCY